MKALVWEGPRAMQLHEPPVPAPGPDEVLIKVKYAGICGSDLSGYLGHNALRKPPLVMGHEFSGEIVELNPAAEEHFSNLALGQAVTANPLLYDGTCEFCVRGLNHLCRNRQLIGAHRPGGFAEYVSVPATQVTPLPAQVSLRTGALTEPVAVGVRIGELAGPVKGQDAFVAGAGPIGLLALQALLANGAARVFISDLDPARLAMAGALGGETLNPRQVEVVKTILDATGGRGVLVAVDCVGAAVTREQCVGATRSAGTVILSGLHEETSMMPAADIIRRELVVRGAFSYSPSDFSKALAQLAQGRFRLEPWVIEAPLADGGKWFDRLIDAPGDVAKVLLTP